MSDPADIAKRILSLEQERIENARAQYRARKNADSGLHSLERQEQTIISLMASAGLKLAFFINQLEGVTANE